MLMLLVCLQAPASAQSGSSVPAGSAKATSASLLDQKTQRSATQALNWLVQAMRPDGTVGIDMHQPPDLACTAITGLALLAEGSTPRSGKYSRQSRRLLYGVLDLIKYRQFAPDGAIVDTTLVQRKIGLNADLFLATLYLSEIYFESPGDEEVIREALQKLILQICQSQRADGTWGSKSWAPVLGTVLGWESLRSANAAGFEIEASARLVGEALLKNFNSRQEEDQNWMFSFYKDAAGLRVLYSLNQRNDPIFDTTVARLLEMAKNDSRPFRLAGGEEYLSFFLVTECLLKEPRPDWQSWYPRVRDELILTQNKDGSWDGHHCITGRTFCTSAALLTLLAPKRTLSTSEL